MHITILTLFPDMFRGPFDESIIKRAIDKKIADITYVNMRDFATDAHKSVDDTPYGGGIGMILRVDIVDKAINYAKSLHKDAHTRVILLDPQGIPFSQTIATRYTTYEHLILICGHYEGVDERIRSLVDEELSIGDYILTCGEIPAMVIVDSVVRLLPQTLSKERATIDESFNPDHPLLEYPQYTKPQTYNHASVPEILLSGHHARIEKWRREQSSLRTTKKRPDLLEKHNK